MRLINRCRVYHGRKNEPKGFNEHDYIRLLDTTHQQLRAPIMLVWDNLNTHKSALMRRLISTRDWLTVFYLLTTAPELNPVEGVWSVRKSGLVNLVKHEIDQLRDIVKHRLQRMQYRPELLAGLLAKTGLDPDRYNTHDENSLAAGDSIRPNRDLADQSVAILVA